jgi:hypothetical protein
VCNFLGPSELSGFQQKIASIHPSSSPCASLTVVLSFVSGL